MSAVPSGHSSLKRVRKPSGVRVESMFVARKSACAALPKVVMRAAVMPRQSPKNASSAFSTALACEPSPWTISPSACATPSRLPKPSRCSAPALVIKPTVGRAMAASSATSPAWFAPISITADRCAACSRNSVSGTPK